MPLENTIAASRSDAQKVAVGFSPRWQAQITPRRVATPEPPEEVRRFQAPLHVALFPLASVHA